MPITILPSNDDSIDFVPLLKNGDIHYVSIAMPGMTVASVNVEFAGGFTVHERNEFMAMINQKEETGTFYPRVNITLLPAPSASYSGFDSNTYNTGDYATETVITHILDAFKANELYIKSNKMYFDFRNLNVSETHYVSCLKLAVKKLQDDGSLEVITWFPS